MRPCSTPLHVNVCSTNTGAAWTKHWPGRRQDMPEGQRGRLLRTTSNVATQYPPPPPLPPRPCSHNILQARISTTTTTTNNNKKNHLYPRRPTAARYHHARAHTAAAPARFTQFAFIAIACCRVVPLLVWAQTGRRSRCIRPCHEAATRNGQQRTTTAARAGLSARRRVPLPFPQAAH